MRKQVEYPDITLLIVTYNRPQVLKETIEHFLLNLSYEGGIKYLVSHDGDGPETRQLLHNELGWQGWVRIVGEGERRGLGANANQGLRESETDIVLQTQDDYRLVKPLDLTEHVHNLLNNPEAGWIRLRLTAGQDFTATVVDRYWRVSWHSQGLYIASDQPHLKHWRRWHEQHYGFYKEGVDLIHTENEWCGRTKEQGQHNPGWPQVWIPTDVQTDSSWQHMGDEISWKRYGY